MGFAISQLSLVNGKNVKYNYIFKDKNLALKHVTNFFNNLL